MDIADLKFHWNAHKLLLNFLQEARKHFNHSNSGGLTLEGLKSLAEKTWLDYGELESEVSIHDLRKMVKELNKVISELEP